MSIHIPTSLDDALALLHELPQVQLLAGGTDFMVEVNFNKHDVHDVV
ncbi:MAG: FAD binding domain-containing protein, partial [Ilumatobacteraceae bacterium]|nr:FAD binding domain-containing protein [Ilumatobacteraceae bacterium]